MAWIEPTPHGVLLRLQAQPRASRTEVVGLQGDRLKIRIAAPPVDGAANQELLRFLKKQLGCPVALVSGETTKYKDVLCTGELTLIQERLGTQGELF